MDSSKNERGVTLIEAAFVLIIFCVIFPLSIYYISLTITVSKAINLGELMYSTGNTIEYMIKSGECVCTSASDQCAECIENAVTDMEKSNNYSGALKVSLSNIKGGASGVSVFIYPTDKTSYTDLDKIYFTLAATKEKAVIVGGLGGGGTINPISNITPYVKGVADNSEKVINLADYSSESYPMYPYPGIYFEVSSD
ncbi:hypothetical protein RCM47_24335 [Escherichia coli]|nr:hypothetical protein [Escherichia coli]